MHSILAALLFSSPVHAKELHSGEFRNTADTTEPGEVVLHPFFMPSSVGITENLDLKFPGILGLAGGPMLGVEYAVLNNDQFAVSIEPSGGTGWSFDNFSFGGIGRFTYRLGEHRLNASAGASYNTLPSVTLNDGTRISGDSYVSVPINIGFDAVASDHTTYRFVATSDLGTTAVGMPFSTFGANWNHGAKDGAFRISLGLAFLVGANPIAKALAGMPDELMDSLPGFMTSKTLVLPAPTFEIWWKI